MRTDFAAVPAVMCHKLFQLTNILNIGCKNKKQWSRPGWLHTVWRPQVRFCIKGIPGGWGRRRWRHISGRMDKGWCRENLLGAVNPTSPEEEEEEQRGDAVQHLGTRSSSLHLLRDTDWRINLHDACVFFLSTQIMAFQTLHRKENPENLTQDLHALATVLSSTTLYIRCAAFAALGIRQSSRTTLRVNKFSP